MTGVDRVGMGDQRKSDEDDVCQWLGVTMAPLFGHGHLHPSLSCPLPNALHGSLERSFGMTRSRVQTSHVEGGTRRLCACEGVSRNLGSRDANDARVFTSADPIRKRPDPSLICSLHEQIRLLL